MEYTGKTQSHVKLDNQRMILNLLFEKGPLSRADIAKKLASSKPTISKNVEGLLAMNMIFEIGKADNSIGKKAMLLDVNGDYGHVLSIDMSKNQLKLVITNLKGEWLMNESHRLEDDFDVIAAIDGFVHRREDEKERVRQVVIAYPGVVGHNNDYYLTRVRMKVHWLENILQYIRHTFEIEAVVKNDVNLATIAEKQHPSLWNVDNLYYISGDTGIGSGVILNHKLYEGDRNAAGEIGFILPPQKLDGDYLTLEDRICINALTTRYYDETGEKVRMSQLIEKVREEEPVAIKFYEEVLSYMSIAITNIASVLDIEHVVVSGRLFMMKEDTVEVLQQKVNKMTPLKTNIIMSSVEEATLKGAIHIGVKEMIDNMIK